jgi:hypothetical protein
MCDTSALAANLSALTHIELVWIKRRTEIWIRFGQIEEEHRLDHQWRVVSFAAGSVFAFGRWASNDDETVLSCIGILRNGPGERCSNAPYVRRGGESLLRVSGWPKVEKVLHAIDVVEALDIDPADAAPGHWRHVHNRLFVGEQPKRSTRSRRRAWLHRWKLVP